MYSINNKILVSIKAYCHGIQIQLIAMESRFYCLCDLSQPKDSIHYFSKSIDWMKLSTCSWYSKDSQDEWRQSRPRRCWLFFRGPNIFFTSFFVQNWKSWFYGKKANNSAIQPQKFKNPGSFTNLIKAILLQQVISSFHMSSFNTWPTSAWVSVQVCPSTASCPLWPTQRPSIISPCVASSFCCPSSWASWFCIQNSRKLSKNEWEIRGWGWGWVFCVESKRIQQQNPNWERVNWFEVTMERNVLKVFGIRLLPIKNLSTKLWLHTILWFFYILVETRWCHCGDDLWQAWWERWWAHDWFENGSPFISLYVHGMYVHIHGCAKIWYVGTLKRKHASTDADLYVHVHVTCMTNVYIHIHG